ncbi:MAG: shikimate dehydrogenase [Acidiferrobacterales bacterium]
MRNFAKLDRYAVMGCPVSHSKSPAIHRQFASQFKDNIEYVAIQVDPGGFTAAVNQFRANGGRGLNITVPFKLEAYQLADIHTPLAQQAGAANTLRFRDDGKIEAHNTDGLGLVRDLGRLLGVPPSDSAACDLEAAFAGKNILVLGAGGAVRGVLGPLLLQSPASLTIANRTLARAEELAGLFDVRALSYERLAGRGFDLVINGTSASLKGQALPLPAGLFSPHALAYDMMYADRPTAFVEWASRHGAAQFADGLGMLVEQAAESYFFWRGKHPDTAPVLANLRLQH